MCFDYLSGNLHDWFVVIWRNINLQGLRDQKVIIFVLVIRKMCFRGENVGQAPPFVAPAPSLGNQNGNVSTKLQRQKLSIGASEASCGNASFKL